MTLSKMAQHPGWLNRKIAGPRAARPGLCVHLAVSALLYCSTVSPARSDAETTPPGRHRLDLSFSSLDAAEGDAYTVLPGYTLTLNEQVRLGIMGSYTLIDSNSSAFESGSGLGDTDLLLQWDPSKNITSSPWIPDNLGVTLDLTVPTGDAGDLLGGDQWVGSIGVGWVATAIGNLQVIPSAAYSRSFAEGSDAAGLELAELGLSLFWVTPWGFWVGFSPFLQRDMEQSGWSDDYDVVVGKMWSNRFGLSLSYGRRNRLDPGARRDDYAGLLSVYYQFGRPD